MPESAKPRKRRSITKRKPKFPVQLSPEEAQGLRNRLGGDQAAQEALGRAERAVVEARVVAGMTAEAKTAYIATLTAKYGLPDQFVLNEDDTADVPPEPSEPPEQEPATDG